MPRWWRVTHAIPVRALCSTPACHRRARGGGAGTVPAGAYGGKTGGGRRDGSPTPSLRPVRSTRGGGALNAPELPVKPRPKVDVDATCKRLQRLGGGRSGERLAEATQAELAPYGLLDRPLKEALSAREERRVWTSLRLSALPMGQTVASSNFTIRPSVERSRI